MNRSKRYLNYNERLEIVKRINAGESCSSIASDYGTTRRTVERVKKKKDEIEAYINKFNEEGGASRKRYLPRGVKNEALEKAVYMWFLQKRHQGEPIAEALLCDKALLLNLKLNGPQCFKASDGWLGKFKRRHGIRHLSMQGEKLSPDVRSAEHFRRDFRERLRVEGYDLENVYNADETGLCWKALPKSSLVAQLGSTASGRRMLKEHVALMVCSNATGVHKLPLLVIGRFKKPQRLRGVSALPIICTVQKDGWMTNPIFTQWFTDMFIPAVEQRQLERGRHGKVILLVDNASSHLLNESVKFDSDKYKIMFLPPNVTANQQPMCQGVVERLKRTYRKSLLRTLLFEDNEEDVAKRIKNLTKKDCCSLLSSAWDSIKTNDLRDAWQRLLSIGGQQVKMEDSEENELPGDREALELLRHVPGFYDCSEDNARSWLQIDAKDPGWEILSEDRIVSSVIGIIPNVENKIISDECPTETDSDICDSDTDSDTRATAMDEKTSTADNVSSKDALTAINVLIKYANKSASFNTTDITYLLKVQAKIKDMIFAEEHVHSLFET